MKEQANGTIKKAGIGGQGTTFIQVIKITSFYDEGENLVLVREEDSRLPSGNYAKYNVYKSDLFKSL